MTALFTLKCEPIGHLCNHEVNKFVREELAVAKQKGSGTPRIYTGVLQDVCKYFDTIDKKCVDSDEVVGQALTALKEFHLDKKEALQIINMKPQSPVEVQLVVQDSEIRLNEEQMDKLVALFSKTAL